MSLRFDLDCVLFEYDMGMHLVSSETLLSFSELGLSEPLGFCQSYRHGIRLHRVEALALEEDL